MNMVASNCQKIMVVDVFLFYNELELLKTRLEYLGPHVDYFVISEANTDFSGKPKKFFLNKEILQHLPHKEKIIYHQENINLKSHTWLLNRLRFWGRFHHFLWKIQDVQRNSTLNPLKSFAACDYIIFGDVDEFPSKTALTEIRKLSFSGHHKAYICEQKLFYYNISNLAENEKWYGTIFTTLENFREILPHKLRSVRNDLAHISNGGWHFSYFMTPEKIKTKVKTIAQVEKIDQFLEMDDEEIQRKIFLGLDLYDRKIVFKKISYDSLGISNSLLSSLKKYLPNCI